MLLRDLVENSESLLPSLPPPVAAQWLSLCDEPLGVFTNWERAEQLLCSAQAYLPEQLSLSEALYKLYAYSNQHEKALHFIRHVLRSSSHHCGFPENPLFTGPEHSQKTLPLNTFARFYLYAMKAHAFVNLRQGDIAQSKLILQHLAILDPFDQVGGSVVAAMADSLDTEEV
jgi:hypothetical protein